MKYTLKLGKLKETICFATTNYSVGTRVSYWLRCKKIVSEYPRLKIATRAHHIMVHSRLKLGFTDR